MLLESVVLLRGAEQLSNKKNNYYLLVIILYTILVRFDHYKIKDGRRVATTYNSGQP